MKGKLNARASPWIPPEEKVQRPPSGNVVNVSSYDSLDVPLTAFPHATSPVVNPRSLQPEQRPASQPIVSQQSTQMPAAIERNAYDALTDEFSTTGYGGYLSSDAYSSYGCYKEQGSNYGYMECEEDIQQDEPPRPSKTPPPQINDLFNEALLSLVPFEGVDTQETDHKSFLEAYPELAANYSRDWNREFQAIYDLELSSFGEVIAKSRQLDALNREFCAFSRAVAELIVKDLSLPVSRRLIPPFATQQGIAGGLKYRVGSVFFKFATDCHGLYGSDDLSHKAASNEHRAINAIVECNVKGLHITLSSLAYIRGNCIMAIAIVPVDGVKTLVYGSCDAGRSFETSSPVMNDLMQELGHRMNLKEHIVIGFRTQQEHVIHSAGDVEGHYSPIDDRNYLIDLARHIPPVTPRKGTVDFLTHQFRPEHMFYRRKEQLPALSSDAWTVWGRHDLKIHNAEAREAHDALLTQILPKFAKYFQQAVQAESPPTPSMSRQSSLSYAAARVLEVPKEFHLTRELHKAGLNLRDLGRVLACLPYEAKKARLMIHREATARVIKVRLRQILRHLSNTCASDEPFLLLAAHLIAVTLVRPSSSSTTTTSSPTTNTKVSCSSTSSSPSLGPSNTPATATTGSPSTWSQKATPKKIPPRTPPIIPVVDPTAPLPPIPVVTKPKDTTHSSLFAHFWEEVLWVDVNNKYGIQSSAVSPEEKQALQDYFCCDNTLPAIMAHLRSPCGVFLMDKIGLVNATPLSRAVSHSSLVPTTPASSNPLDTPASSCLSNSHTTPVRGGNSIATSRTHTAPAATAAPTPAATPATIATPATPATTATTAATPATPATPVTTTATAATVAPPVASPVASPVAVHAPAASTSAAAAAKSSSPPCTSTPAPATPTTPARAVAPGSAPAATPTNFTRPTLSDLPSRSPSPLPSPSEWSMDDDVDVSGETPSFSCNALHMPTYLLRPPLPAFQDAASPHALVFEALTQLHFQIGIKEKYLRNPDFSRLSNAERQLSKEIRDQGSHDCIAARISTILLELADQTDVGALSIIQQEMVAMQQWKEFHPLMISGHLVSSMTNLIVNSVLKQETKLTPARLRELLTHYCALAHLLSAFAVRYPVIKRRSIELITSFHQDPSARHKKQTHDIGQFLIHFLIADTPWDRLAIPVLLELFDRQVRWMLQKFPECQVLGPGERGPTVSRCYRLSRSWESGFVGCQLFMLQVLFLRLTQQNLAATPSDTVSGEFHRTLGAPREEDVQQLLKWSNTIMKVSGWPQFFDILQVARLSPNSLEARLKQAQTNSLQKGYHTKFRVQHLERKNFPGCLCPKGLCRYADVDPPGRHQHRGPRSHPLPATPPSHQPHNQHHNNHHHGHHQNHHNHHHHAASPATGAAAAAPYSLETLASQLSAGEEEGEGSEEGEEKKGWERIASRKKKDSHKKNQTRDNRGGRRGRRGR